jgi:NADH-quinone oxidoreductase subunit D/NADH-quinone oxidoreductase subunit C/D
MTLQTPALENTLDGRFPEAVARDERKGYEGYLVKPENLLEVATFIRDEMGYDYLSSVTAVDYLPEGKMEVVYHTFRSTGGPALVFKTQTARENSAVPSLVPIYPGAEFQEREAWDLFGIRFEGHPDLRRILLWEGFDGHPMRKDWREPFYEEEGSRSKPLAGGLCKPFGGQKSFS